MGNNIIPPKAFYKVLHLPPKQLIEVQKLYKISEMCWTLDSQHCLGGGVDIIDVLPKIWLSVPNTLAMIVVTM